MKRYIFNTFIAILICFASFTSCDRNNSDKNRLVLEDCVYVTSFPEDILSGSCELVDLDINGMMSIAVQDSLLMVSTMGRGPVAHVFNIQDMSSKGAYINIGNGPSELDGSFYFGSCRCHVTDHGELMVDIPNNGKNILRWNVTQSIACNEIIAETTPTTSVHFSAYWKVLDDSSSFSRKLSPDFLRLERQVLVNNERLDIAGINELNKAEVSVNDGISFNLLSGFVAYSESERVLVDASISTNVINFIPLNGAPSKSIIIGPKAVSLNEAEKKQRIFHDIKQYFISASSDYSYCAFLYRDNSGNYSVLMFDWQGNPIRRIAIPNAATAFCFDSERHLIYTLDSSSDQLYRYCY